MNDKEHVSSYRGFDIYRMKGGDGIEFFQVEQKQSLCAKVNSAWSGIVFVDEYLSP